MNKYCKHYEEPYKYTKKLIELRVICQCGHSLMIPVYMPYKTCNWCYRKVLNNSKARFKYMLERKMKDKDIRRQIRDNSEE